MRLVTICWCFCFLLIWGIKSYGQVCQGSLGDPIFKQTFGAGPNPGAPLPATATTYLYNAGGCPNDGSYSIINSISPNCHSTWHALPHDHTGDTNGYMMLVNASYDAGVFYTQQAPVLCNNTTYEFSAYIINLITPQAEAGNPILPNITFVAQTVDGTVLGTSQTGDIPTTSDINGWVKYAVTFKAPANNAAVIVKMINNARGGNGNDLVIDDITFRACGPVVNAGFGNGNMVTTQDQPLCYGNAANFTLSASLGQGFESYIYQWQESINGSSWTDIPDATTKSYPAVFTTTSAAGTYQYRIAVALPENMSSLTCRTYSDALAVRVIDNPVASVSSPVAVCTGDAFTLTASGGTTYHWTGPDNVTLPDQTASITINNAGPANSGTYQVTAFNQYNCPSAPVSTRVTVVPKMMTTISNDTTVCSGSPVTLMATGGLHYRWQPSAGLLDSTSAAIVVTPAQTTTYNVRIDNGACFDSKTVKVTVLDSPGANAGPDKVIFEGQSVMLNGLATGENINYYWTPTTFLDDPKSLTPNATPTDNITYTLHVVSSNGCGIATDSVFVKVHKSIIVPNTFSPNGDGVNDTWNIEALITYPQCDLQVYNRYGEVVFKSTGYGKPWNGTYKGKPLTTGAYYYVLDLKNGKPKMSGWVAIVR